MSDVYVTSTTELETVAAEWEELADSTHASPFVRPGWIAAWWRAFGKGRLEIRVVRRAKDGKAAALVPVRVHQGALLSPTNWHTPQFGIVTGTAEARAALLDSLFQSEPRRVSLAFVGDDDAAVLDAEAAARDYRVIRRTLQRSPYLTIQGGWDAYQHFLGSKMRRELRRRQRLLAARGSLTFEVTSGQRLDELLEEGYAVEASGWKGRRGSAIASTPACRGFYTDVARWAAGRGWLRLGFLRLDGQPLAFDYALEHEGVHYLLKTGYADAHADLAPGKIMRSEMIARAFRKELRSYEFLGTADPWKLEWTGTTRPRELVQTFRPSAFGVIDWSVFAVGRPVAKSLRDAIRR